MSLTGADKEEEEEQETAAEKWGLMWDSEEGPVWGNIRDSEGEEQEDTWTQLLRGGVSGITTDRDGEDRSHICIHVLTQGENILLVLTFIRVQFRNLRVN